jgi:SAM-dependent methyltransferase
MALDEYLSANQAHWDELVPIHERSAFYDQASFLAGRCTLDPLDLEEMGDVRGLSLLHLQSHFGQDTLSWARRGARAVGADFSQPAVDLGNRLAKELDLDARFVQGNLYDLPEVLEERFDRVYTGGGALCWLPDLDGWARVVSHFLKPGGVFYMREIHPVSLLFDEKQKDALGVGYRYFPGPEPDRWDEGGSYADGEARTQNTVTYEWAYPLGTVVTALIRAGLRLESLREFTWTCFRQHPMMEQGPDGRWRLPERYSVPLTFSVRAVKEGE